MNHAERQALLVRLGINQSDLARELDIRPAAISGVVSGKSRSRRIERLISERTGVSLAVLWPQWYGGGELVVDEMSAQPVTEVRDAPASYGAGALALTDQERRIVHLLRAMTPEQRARGLQALKMILADLDPAAGSTVSASGKGSRAAGRDVKG